MSESFLFYDLETFGQDPCRTRIAQFAALRTTVALEPIAPPETFFVQPADDLLPSPHASLITGITPQHALDEGICEAEAFGRIAQSLEQAGTCTVGYNSLRFDDEFIRFGLYRNFYDPYAREWRNGNSRWDVLDLMRLAYALRPEGMEWPTRADGTPSFRLEDLAAANAVRDGLAHEALSDVKATIGLAQCLRNSQPRLWNYALQLRNKRFCADLLQLSRDEPVLHISHRYAATRRCAAPVLPIAAHPTIGNRIIVCDLTTDCLALLDLTVEQIQDCLFTPRADLPSDAPILGLKLIHLSKCPALVRWCHLRPADFDRLAIAKEDAQQRAKQLRCHHAVLHDKIQRVFAHAPQHSSRDADAALYEGFIGDEDRALLPMVRQSHANDLRQFTTKLRDPRLKTLLLRYRARNWGDTLSRSERDQWDTYRRHRLTTDSGLSEYTLAEYADDIAQLRLAHAPHAQIQSLLDRLTAWGVTLEQSL